jgi:hypothetical protein
MSKKTIRSTNIKKERKEVKPSATSMTNITYLMRNSPKKLTEQEARLFLTQFQKKYPKNSIEVTKDGKILIKAKDGRITTRGIDGKPIIKKKTPIPPIYYGKSEKKDSYTGHVSDRIKVKEAKIGTKYSPKTMTRKTLKALGPKKEPKTTFTEKIGKSIEKEKKLTFTERIGRSKKKSK